MPVPDSDEIAIDYIAKMENLHEEPGAIFERFDLSFNSDRLPRRLAITNANATSRGYCGHDGKARLERFYAKELHASDGEF